MLIDEGRRRRSRRSWTQLRATVSLEMETRRSKEPMRAKPQDAITIIKINRQMKGPTWASHLMTTVNRWWMRILRRIKTRAKISRSGRSKSTIRLSLDQMACHFPPRKSIWTALMSRRVWLGWDMLVRSTSLGMTRSRTSSTARTTSQRLRYPSGRPRKRAWRSWAWSRRPL